ncbi:MAG: hypothetical protein HY760_01525 [Nitrospirae bacterium]|nr:hypothetical protein [Nitrospirota bacterium]
MKGFWVHLVFVLFLAAPAFATHEVDHRYVIYGHVGDDRGRPMAGKKVTAIDATTQLQESTPTDSSRNYEVLLHLHDVNRGDALEVWVEDQKKEGTIEFDPEDKKTDRRHRVDFGPSPAETGGGPWYWLSGGALLGAAAWGMYRWTRGKGKSKEGAQKKARRKTGK